ncbi:MAG TPA: circadian clock protein KaiC [Verrucomicrobiae bacterium]|jgi:circadian clock protein KaiC|nr:circadian clock protein KaiC [Verrucomicrobiae bacterium]
MSQGKTMRSPGLLKKVPTGISGFDEITCGGVPAGRPTLICGGAGCGKSLFATEFLVRGAMQFHEPGVLMTFEETAEDIKKNVASLGFDIAEMTRKKKIFIDHVRVERSEIEENGEYDLEGLFVRLNHAIQTIGAKRVVLDTIETLFAGLTNQGILRSELRRLFGWLKEKGMTTVITGERGEGTLTRHGLEEYVSDCVVLLDHRVTGQISTRRMRIVKYRGSIHGTNEYPFLIDETGVSVLPITAAEMDYEVSSQRISTGVPELDHMLDGKGYFRGSTILLSGSAGTGKTSLASHLADVTCRRGERCLYFSFEESQSQINRNMESIGLHLEPHFRKGLLKFHATRPTVYGLEMHLVLIHKMIEQFKPAVAVFDPVTNLQSAGTLDDSINMLLRLIDFLRKKNVTCFMTSLTAGGSKALEMSDAGMSSIVDTWLLLRDVELGGERNRLMYVLKSRGMAHSNQVREFLISSKGVKLVEAYLGSEGVLTGSARLNQLNLERGQEQIVKDEMERKKMALEHQRKVVEAQIEALRAGFLAEKENFLRSMASGKLREEQIQTDRRSMVASRRIGNRKRA